MITDTRHYEAAIGSILKTCEESFQRQFFMHQVDKVERFVHYDNINRWVEIQDSTFERRLQISIHEMGDGMKMPEEGVKKIMQDIMDTFFQPEFFPLKSDETVTARSNDVEKMAKKHLYLVKCGYEPFGEVERVHVSSDTTGTSRSTTHNEEFLACGGLLFDQIGYKETGKTGTHEEHTVHNYEYQRVYVKGK